MDRFVALSRRHRRWLLLLAAASAAGYGAYRIYHHPSVARSRLSADLNSFLRSDADEVPASLRQIAKLARSEEFVGSLSRVSEALTVGFVRGYDSSYGSGGEIEELGGSESASRSSFSDKLLDKLFSTAGSGFASVVAGSLARNLVIGFYTNGSEGGGGSSSSYSPDVSRWIEVICGDKCKEMIGNCIQIFVSTAVASTWTRPWTSTPTKSYSPASQTLSTSSHDRISSDQSSKSGGGWVDTVSSTLAVPSNRKFVLDVTGRITFETVRSFLEFMLWKILDGARRGVNAVREEVIGGFGGGELSVEIESMGLKSSPQMEPSNQVEVDSGNVYCDDCLIQNVI
uniref:Protein PHLOEM PROTEIN 2-LIKE A10 n=1 Tax=Ananas comosus var. bracteatus TaxID=296719 RepID=A0A6V7QDY1_ANACO|nr:unnamed protein product [Ananas comosus var. bracteatus]